MWSRGDVRFEMVDDMSGERLVTLEIAIPIGTLVAMGEPTTEDRVMIVRGLHMHAIGLGPNQLGPAALRMVADAFLREMDLDGLVIEGAVRTSGANPGTRPRPIRFARRPGAAARPVSG